MAKSKTVFCCSECGAETYNWAGKCPSCGAWNTLVEFKPSDTITAKSASSMNARQPKKLNELTEAAEIRFSTGVTELDRVLGGGAVIGSLILVGGAPGIGKSTLLLQMCRGISDKTILYISGEESERQVKLRAMRMGVSGENIYILSETAIDSILNSIDRLKPDIVILDSIQTIYDSDSNSSPGSVSQIRECTSRIMRYTKNNNCTTFIIGHINKEGSIAGPKVLEHMVDCVLYFEGENNTFFRILRAAKNRFGSTNEIGVFEMSEEGLNCVDNPSELLLSGRPVNSPGTCVTCVIEGSRPILAEIQALICPASYNAARRTNGIDYNRAAMLLAVLEKRGGLSVSNCDAYINVIGGLTLDEPAADLATVLAAASSILDKPVGKEVVAVGEVGLSGEIRGITAINQRLSEISRLGFKKCIVPAHGRNEIVKIRDLEIIKVSNIYEAVHAVL